MALPMPAPRARSARECINQQWRLVSDSARLGMADLAGLGRRQVRSQQSWHVMLGEVELPIVVCHTKLSWHFLGRPCLQISRPGRLTLVHPLPLSLKQPCSKFVRGEQIKRHRVNTGCSSKTRAVSAFHSSGISSSESALRFLCKHMCPYQLAHAASLT